VVRACKRRPSLLAYSVDGKLRPSLAFCSSKLCLPIEKLPKILTTNPTILFLAVGKLEDKVSVLTKLGLTLEEVGVCCGRSPNLLNLDVAKKVDSLRGLFGYNDADLKVVIRRAPHVLGFAIDNLTDKVSALMKVGLTKEEVGVCGSWFPALWGFDVAKRVENLRHLSGYSDEVLKAVIMDRPQILGMDLTGPVQEPKLRWLVEEAGIENPWDVVQRQPNLLAASMEKLGSRTAFLQSRGVVVPETLWHVTPADGVFCRWYANTRGVDAGAALLEFQTFKTEWKKGPFFQRYLEGRQSQMRRLG
jgi:mTERF